VSAHTLDCCGETLTLLPERAIHWAAARTLIAADVHLGKGAALRRQGVAVPSGSSAADLGRLSHLIQTYPVQRLLLLGDVFHSRPQADEPLMAAFEAFRQAHPDLLIEIVRGNHDRPLSLPAHWQLVWREEGAREGPFVWRHTPGRDPRGYVLCGHLHPAWVLRTRRERARLPVFWWGAAQAVLPSFGQLTGGLLIEPAPCDRLYGVLPGAVVPLPLPQAERRPRFR
jgi:uncharacterized protein